MKRSVTVVGVLASLASARLWFLFRRSASSKRRVAAPIPPRSSRGGSESGAGGAREGDAAAPVQRRDSAAGHARSHDRRNRRRLDQFEGPSLRLFAHRQGRDGAWRHAAELFEFDQNYKFVKQWAPDQYGASFAHSVRVDKSDNVWFVDEGSNMVVKMDQNGVVKMDLGRKPEAIDYLERFIERGEKDAERYPNGGVGTFGRPTDVAWDAQDNIYISDGYTNSRFVKLAKDGTWVKAIGTHGNGPISSARPTGLPLTARWSTSPTGATTASRSTTARAWPSRRVSRASARRGCAGHAEVRLQRRRHRQNLSAGQGHRETSWLDSVRDGPGADRLHHPRLHAVSDNVLIKGSCSEWNMEKITFKGTSATQ